MAINPYPAIRTSTDYQVYEFISDGKQRLRKRVRFELVDEVEQIYNLTLCTVLDNEDEDCDTASKNRDMEKVLETVGMIVFIYTNYYPDRKIYFRGSDKLRTRQYQLSMFSNLNTIVNYFIVEGLVMEEDEIKLRENFKTGKNYDAFILTRKKD